MPLFATSFFSLIPLPQKTVLASQVVEILRTEVSSGRWKGWLPSERTLCDLLKISRPTLRRALKSLEGERAVRPVHRKGYQILPGAARAAANQEPVTVHLLSPDPLGQLRHYSHLWIAELRFKLFKHGYDLQVHHGGHYLGPGAERSLARLVAQYPNGVWILVHSSRIIQRWFTTHGIPAVITGSRHEGCNLSRVVVNMEAVCRHAAGELIRLGHRHIALVRMKTDRAGDLESDRGFLNGAELARHAVRAQIIQYDEDDPAVIARTLQRLMRLRDAPTGLLMAHASGYATVATWLSENGKRIPADISLICREDDSFLRYLMPRPASYQHSPRSFALKVDSLVQQLIRQPKKGAREIHIIPRYRPGHSVGPPPRAGA